MSSPYSRAGIAVALLLALGGVLPLGPAFAQQPPEKTRTRDPQTGAAPLKHGAQWTNHGTAYAVVPEVRAVMTTSKDEPAPAALERAGSPGATVMERKGGFLLFKPKVAPPRPAGGLPAPPLVASKTDPRPVVLNLRTQKLAVVLSTIRAELKDATDAEAIATDMGVTLAQRFPNRPVVFYSVPAGMDLLGLVNRMRADPRVAAADLELIEYTRTPQ